MSKEPRTGIIWAAGVLGFGLGGFFDGILLHQVLQWHHLLSLVPGEPFRDLGTQILADGLFHVLMYLVTALGLWLLWRQREALSQGSGRTLLGVVLLGFGVWNLVDVGFFHWILGIHRIRIDVPDPMAYDLGWLGAFGLVPLLIAWGLLRRPGDGGGAGRSAAALSIIAVAAAGIAALPQSNANSALVLLSPGSTAADAFHLSGAAGARPLWIDPEGRMMAVLLEEGTQSRLYGAGAWFVTRSPALAGCAASLRS